MLKFFHAPTLTKAAMLQGPLAVKNPVQAVGHACVKDAHRPSTQSAMAVLVLPQRTVSMLFYIYFFIIFLTVQHL